MHARLALPLMQALQRADSPAFWARLFEEVLKTCREPLVPERAGAMASDRDGEVAALDLFLASAAWTQWETYEKAAPRTAERLAAWWARQPPGRAVLILDGLSLRELPWLTEGARSRGYRVHAVEATGAELPADTSSFARALGFPSRAAVGANGVAATAHKLPGATTDTTDLPFQDCVPLVVPQPDWMFWHAWPDEKLHALEKAGHGHAALAADAAAKLRSDPFWSLVERLSTGRRLVITSDHGYAASGLFPDTVDEAQTKRLKSLFGAKRFVKAAADEAAWAPPADLALVTTHGEHRFVLGRRKWKVSGGFPTLTHGGLSILEVAVPWVELGR